MRVTEADIVGYLSTLPTGFGGGTRFARDGGRYSRYLLNLPTCWGGGTRFARDGGATFFHFQIKYGTYAVKVFINI